VLTDHLINLTFGKVERREVPVTFLAPEEGEEMQWWEKEKMTLFAEGGLMIIQ
jgi:hypothetical protein